MNEYKRSHQIVYYIELSAARLQTSTGKQEMKYKTLYNVNIIDRSNAK